MAVVQGEPLIVVRAHLQFRRADALDELGGNVDHQFLVDDRVLQIAQAGIGEVNRRRCERERASRRTLRRFPEVLPRGEVTFHVLHNARSETRLI